MGGSAELDAVAVAIISGTVCAVLSRVPALRHMMRYGVKSASFDIVVAKIRVECDANLEACDWSTSRIFRLGM